jgi:hypothetical protein
MRRTVANQMTCLLIGIVAGTFSGLIGIGGGIVMVPAGQIKTGLRQSVKFGKPSRPNEQKRTARGSGFPPYIPEDCIIDELVIRRLATRH